MAALKNHRLNKQTRVRSLVKLLYAHVGLKDVSPGLHCLHSIQKLTPWSLTPEIRADKWRWRRTKQVPTRNLKGTNTLPFISGESLTSKTREEACDHRNNPVTGAALFYHKRGLHQPHVAIHAAASLAGELHSAAEMGSMSVVSALVCKSQEDGCQGKSPAIWILSDTQLCKAEFPIISENLHRSLSCQAEHGLFWP